MIIVYNLLINKLFKERLRVHPIRPMDWCTKREELIGDVIILKLMTSLVLFELIVDCLTCING